jgi:hypothetical protein
LKSATYFGKRDTKRHKLGQARHALGNTTHFDRSQIPRTKRRFQEITAAHTITIPRKKTRIAQFINHQQHQDHAWDSVGMSGPSNSRRVKHAVLIRARSKIACNKTDSSLRKRRIIAKQKHHTGPHRRTRRYSAGRGCTKTKQSRQPQKEQRQRETGPGFSEA